MQSGPVNFLWRYYELMNFIKYLELATEAHND